jgi:hypothetical protein
MEDGRRYSLQEESYRGYILSAWFAEVSENEFRLSVTMHMPPEGYTMNDAVAEYRLLINGTIEVVAESVTIIFTTVDGAYEVYYGSAYFEGEITSLRICPLWDKLKSEGTLIPEDAMEFSI